MKSTMRDSVNSTTNPLSQTCPVFSLLAWDTFYSKLRGSWALAGDLSYSGQPLRRSEPRIFGTFFLNLASGLPREIPNQRLSSKFTQKECNSKVKQAVVIHTEVVSNSHGICCTRASDGDTHALSSTMFRVKKSALVLLPVPT